MPVLFGQGLQKIITEPKSIFIEVGPHQTLSLLVKNHPNYLKEQTVISTLPNFPLDEDEYQFFINSLNIIREKSISF
ncbi:MAG: hypothetical protein GY756_11215 [bacterium]|nr:hypothetical protein [bacterium]